MKTHCSIGVCTPIPGEDSDVAGVRRLCRITPAWHRARSAMLMPMGVNVAEVYADGMEVGVARNLAVRNAREAGMKYLFFLDWDTIPTHECLCKLVYHLDNNPDFDIAAGMYCAKTQPPWPLLWREWQQGVSWDWTLGEVLRERVVGVPMGCTLLRLALFDRLPATDEWFETRDGITEDELTKVKFHATEDLSFCMKYEDLLRGKILVDTGIQCPHIDHNTGIQFMIPDDSLPVRRARSIVDGQKKLLHVGCGPVGTNPVGSEFQGDGWREIRLDIDERAKPDIVASMTDMRQVKEGAIDAIVCYHALEHLNSGEVVLALKEFARVMKRGGVVDIAVPDIQAVGAELAAGNLDKVLYESQAGPICTIDIVYGYSKFLDNGNVFQLHKTGFTEDSMRQQLESAGFENVEIVRQQEIYGLRVKATKKG